MDYPSYIIKVVDFSPYISCFLISSVIAFIDILDDYSIIQLKMGFRYKLLFSLLNGLTSLILLVLFWDEVFTDLNPFLKGVFVGFFYPSIMKSKLLLYDKKDPSESISLERIYNKIMNIFIHLIEDSQRRFTTKTKIEIASKNDVEILYNHILTAIEDDPRFDRKENEVEKKELLDRIEAIKNDNSSDDLKRKALAKSIINYYPSDINKLCRECGDPRSHFCSQLSEIFRKIRY